MRVTRRYCAMCGGRYMIEGKFCHNCKQRLYDTVYQTMEKIGDLILDAVFTLIPAKEITTEEDDV